MEKRITLDQITKIEGHASLELSIEKGKVKKCNLSAVEGARYFEGIVLNRDFTEAFEITSRICGICSCAHTIAAILAVEEAVGYTPSEQTTDVRKMLTLGERIRSHATHLYFLALPDYLGKGSALALLPEHKKEIETALRLMKTGNRVVRVIGGRDIHPVSAGVGGWRRLPSKEEARQLAAELGKARKDALATARLFASLPYPRFERATTQFSLTDPKEYAIFGERIACENHSHDKDHYHDFLREYHESDSTANFVVKEGKAYMVGALSRINNNGKQLSDGAKKILQDSQFQFPSESCFANNYAQAVELVHCIEHLTQLLNGYAARKEDMENVKPREGTGIGVLEVPRGTLWHEYSVEKSGRISKANIITPTAQNLKNMEEDIRAFLPGVAAQNKEAIVHEVEKLIRSYDPCFSCSAHFLNVKWD